MMKTYKTNAIVYKKNGEEYLEMLIYGGKERAEEVLATMPKDKDKEYYIKVVETWD